MLAAMSTDTPRYTIVPVAERQAYWIGGQRQAVIVGAAETGKRYALSHSTIAVGGGASEHHHSREAEAFYVIAGSLRFSLDGRTIVLNKGDFLHAEPGLKYSFEVLPPETCEVLILYAPGGLEQFIAEEGIADPADQAQARQAEVRSVEEAQKVFAAAPGYGVNYTALKK
jgi:quercetin dioxygenase-like cupin family protein